MNEVDISRNITEYRKRKELTIKELANLTGVTPSLLSQIEKGTSNPSINTLKQISSALDIPLFNFFINDNFIRCFFYSINWNSVTPIIFLT